MKPSALKPKRNRGTILSVLAAQFHCARAGRAKLRITARTCLGRLHPTPSVAGDVIVGSLLNTKDAIGAHGPIIVSDSLLAQAVHDANYAASMFAMLTPFRHNSPRTGR